MSKVYCYSRVSTDKQENSLNAQERMLKDFCDKQGFTDVVYLSDNAVSGGKMLFNRPEGSKLKDLTNGDSLIVRAHDRLFRSFINAVNVTHELVNKGVNIYFIQDSYEPVSFVNYHKEFKLYLDYAMAHMDKRKIGSNTKQGLNNRRLNGQTNSAPKMGYDNVYEIVDGKEVGKEVPNEKEQQTLLRANELRKKMSAYKVATKLNNEALYTKNGLEWKGSNIDTILDRAYKNGVFLGVKYWRDAR
jgi:DNA invertase Pin-like site-specific DNA recombinase